jgi:hypothetical protein
MADDEPDIGEPEVASPAWAARLTYGITCGEKMAW